MQARWKRASRDAEEKEIPIRTRAVSMVALIWRMRLARERGYGAD
jgi:hypothetical protein